MFHINEVYNHLWSLFSIQLTHSYILFVDVGDEDAFPGKFRNLVKIIIARNTLHFSDLQMIISNILDQLDWTIHRLKYMQRFVMQLHLRVMWSATVMYYLRRHVQRY